MKRSDANLSFRAHQPGVILALLLVWACGPTNGPRDAAGQDDAASDSATPDAALPDATLADVSSPDVATSPGLCDVPAGNLLPNNVGDFEAGMDGLAPTGWQVRTPGAPSTCEASGTPAEHVYLTASVPACGGTALVIDTLDQWDCYAVQTFTDYNTIQGGRTYRVSVTAKSEGQVIPECYFIIGLQWLDGNDGVFGDEKNPVPADVNFDWTRIEFDLVAPSEARRAVVWLTGHYSGRVYYDKVSLAPVD